jgi:DNA mismatch repair protein MutS
VSERIREIQRIGDFIATLDCLLSLSEVASLNHYVRPTVDDSEEIIIREGRHPVIEKTSPEPFVPNDTRISPEERLLIITGPNMAGKSTYIRQVALMVILAQMGAFVPAKEAKIGLADRIFSRIGAMDDISRGQSTFMVEMRETASILKEATPKSLVILDEIGRGTSTYDGLAIAWAVVEHLHNVNRSRVLFATHYHELIELGNKLPYARNYHVAVKEYHGEVVFLREVRPGGMNKSYGIQVARLAGLPNEVIQRAKEILQRLERDSKTRDGFSKEALQLFLFSQPKSSPILKELEQIDPDRLTPLKALELIYRWKGMTS